MRCPKCGGTNITATTYAVHELEQKKPGCLWWAFVGVWWVPLKWLFLTIPALVVKIFKPKNYRMKAEEKTSFVCLDCGHTWIP